MPPPSLSRTTNVASMPRRAAPRRPPASWRKVRSPHRATTGSAERAAATPSTVDTKPSMPLTPRLHRKRSPERGRAKDSTSRTGMLDPTTSVAPVGSPATRSRATRPSKGSAHESSRRSRSRRAAASADSHDDSQNDWVRAAPRRLTASSRAVGSATIRSADARCGSSQAPSGSTTIWRTEASSQVAVVFPVRGAPSRTNTSGRSDRVAAGERRRAS